MIQPMYRVAIRWRKLPNRKRANLNYHVIDVKADEASDAILYAVAEFKKAKRRAYIIEVEAEVVYV